MLVSSVYLSVLFILSNIYIYLSSNPLDMMNNFYFAYTMLGIVVGIELLTTTFMQSIMAKYNSKYEDLALLGEADYILIFTVSAVLNSLLLVSIALLLHAVFSFIYDIIINKRENSHMPMFPTTTLSLFIIYIIGDFIKDFK